MTILGVDLSHYNWGQGTPDFGGMARAGVQFATHKATEGTGYVDPKFGDFCAHAHDTIPLPGAYHVLHSGNIGAQVDLFLTQLHLRAPWWQDGPFLIQLDCERWANDFPPPSDVEAWCDRFKALTGGTHEPVVYASRGQYGDRIGGVCPLWNADYPTRRPGDFRSLYPGDQGAGWGRYSNRVPALWQFSSNATVGNQHGLDVNAFRGTLDDLKALAWLRGDDVLTPDEFKYLKAVAARLLAIETMQPTLVTSWAGNPTAVEQVEIVQKILAQQAATAALGAKLDGLVAAVHALATGGTSIDTAAVVSAVNAAGDRESAAVTDLGARLAVAQQQITDLTARLAAAGHAIAG